MEQNQALLRVEHLTKWFPVKSAILARGNGHIKAVSDISFTLSASETLGLVGESGCGKSTLGRTILRLLEPTSGKVFFKGLDLFTLSGKEIRSLRPEMQIIFQDPYASLDPRHTIGEAVVESLDVQKRFGKPEKLKLVTEIMEKVGLNIHTMNRYPHEFSGGQRQRVGIARAMILKPKLIVCDEPVSALDVSIQAQVINLLKELQGEFGVAYIFISHDLSVIRHISDRVLVMYLGKAVELAPKEALFSKTLHPYTKALLQAVPVPNRGKKREISILPGDIPSPADPPSGCYFRTRCPLARKRCTEETPPFREYEPGHFCACHLVEAPASV
jgi:oligopeptide/dipeptide ABC transporter ATP-binding protein